MQSRKVCQARHACLEFEVVVGGVLEEHGLLLAGEALEPNVGLDDKLDEWTAMVVVGMAWWV